MLPLLSYRGVQNMLCILTLHWSTSTPYFLVEYRMAIHMILSLLKLVRTFVLYSTTLNLKELLLS